MQDLKDYSTVSSQAAISALTSSEQGLCEIEAGERLQSFGRNELPEAQRRSAIVLFLKQFKSVLVAVLFLAAILSWLTGHQTDAYIILIVVLIDSLIGFIQEWKAEQAVSALHKMLTPLAKVVREGQKRVIKATELVPGDIIILEEGDYVPADARLIEVKNLRSIESSLTGESLPVSKTSEILSKAFSIGDRKNIVWKSTFISGGYAKAIVIATGLNTAIGHVAKSLSSIKVEPSHFQKKINRLGTQMAIASVVAAVVLFSVGYFTLDMAINELFLLAVAAMVSIIPEGLPSIIAIVLAIGSRRMTKRNAIVREFTATETLGAVTTIITDKTGTLTENALTVRKIYLPGQSVVDISGEGWQPLGSFEQNATVIEPKLNNPLSKLVRIAAFCNNSSIRHKPEENAYELIGDPTEGALLVLSKKGGLDIGSSNVKKIDDQPFNSAIKMRASLTEDVAGRELYVIGAPEKVLRRCNKVLTPNGILPMDETMRGTIQKMINDWSLDAMRVIALAYKEYQSTDIDEEDLDNLIFSGLTGMIDPPREEVKESVRQCKEAGIRVIMATGDHISTAVAIAKAVGIIDINAKKEVIALSEEQLMVLDQKEFDNAIKTVNVFARLNPETKLKIAGRLQELGELIAMTGDGVNDAPALKKADVGGSVN